MGAGNQASYAQVINTLGDLIVARSRVELEIQGSDKVFSCVVAAMDEAHGEFVIDELNPLPPVSLLMPERDLRLIIAGASADVVIAGRYVEPLIENSYTAHQIKIPSQLIEIPRTCSVDIVLSDIDAAPDVPSSKLLN